MLSLSESMLAGSRLRQFLRWKGVWGLRPDQLLLSILQLLRLQRSPLKLKTLGTLVGRRQVGARCRLETPVGKTGSGHSTRGCRHTKVLVEGGCKMKRIRGSMLVIATIVTGLLLAPGAASTIGPSPEVQIASGIPVLQTAELASHEMALTDCETSMQPQYEQAAGGGGNPCNKSCPKSLAPGCTRVSCDPCCFRCPGEPFLRCL